MAREFRDRLTAGFREARERDTRWIMKLDIRRLERKIFPLLISFVVLNFLDVLTTTVALNSSSSFQELNPLASALFQLHFQGFVVALGFKYLPVIPLLFIAFSRDTMGHHPVSIRVLKLSGLVALAAANIFYILVVASNASTLLAFFGVWDLQDFLPHLGTVSS